MYSKKDIEKNLIEYNYFIDSVTLANFIKNWKIDAIYEDEDVVEFYDNLAIAKLKKGISLKSQGYSNEQIIFHINKLLPEKLDDERKIPTRKELPAQVNKTDLKEDRQVSYEEGRNFAMEHNMLFFECSAKTRENIEEMSLHNPEEKINFEYLEKRLKDTKNAGE